MRRLGTLLVIVGAAVLVGSLFFEWYSYDISKPNKSTAETGLFVFAIAGSSAWEAFELIDFGLLICGLAAVVVVLVRGFLPERALIVLAALALFLVASQLIDPPPAIQAAEDFDVSVRRQAGVWLGLGGSLAMLGGAVLRRVTLVDRSSPL